MRLNPEWPGRPVTRKKRPSPQLDIFGITGVGDIGHRLADNGAWPDARRFPVNLPGRNVRDQVVPDLKVSASPLIVTGYASLDRIIDLLASVNDQSAIRVRLVLGNEPFESRKKSFALANQSFPEQVRDYWLERGISLYLSAQLIFAIKCLKNGRVEARFIDDTGRSLHAKIYVGDQAATAGSSNFTQAGLSSQLEQMESVVRHYSAEAVKAGDDRLRARWDAILKACAPEDGETRPDLDAVAEEWLHLVRPVWFEKLRGTRKRGRPFLLNDIRRDLIVKPLAIAVVEAAFKAIPVVAPLDERIGACIIGVSLPGAS